jgi:hypothetical protein
MAIGVKFGRRLNATTPDLALRVKAALICFRGINSVQSNFECTCINRIGIHNPRHEDTRIGTGWTRSTDENSE